MTKGAYTFQIWTIFFEGGHDIRKIGKDSDQK